MTEKKVSQIVLMTISAMVSKEKMKGIGQEVKPMDNQIGFFDPVDFIAG